MKVRNPGKIKSLLKKYSKLAFDLGLVWGTSGNMSVKKDEHSFFITVSGKSLGDIAENDLVLCRINNRIGSKKASMEWRLHGEVYRNQKDAKAIFHSQPPFSTLIACSKDKKIMTELIPETIAYLQKIEVIPYYHAGSIELAQRCGEGARKADVLLLENHGLVAFGACIEEAVNKTLTFEFLCKLIILSKTAGIELRTIPPRKAKEFLRLMARRKKV